MSEGVLRRIDHVVMPVESLDGIRDRLSALGFTVAPNATHPFGTANACVFFADGTYIEPLAIADPERCQAEARAGNVFVASDQSFRSRADLPSLSGIAIASTDADADRDRFAEARISAGDNLEFRRIARSPTGEEAELGFRLAFAGDRKAPDLSFFTCQTIHTFKPDRRALTEHANGVHGLARIVLSAPEPTHFEDVLRTVFGAEAEVSDEADLLIGTGNTIVEVLSPGTLRLRYGIRDEDGQGLRIAGLVLATDTVYAMAERARRSDLVVRVVSGRVVVDLRAGRPVFVAFEALPRHAENGSTE